MRPGILALGRMRQGQKNKLEQAYADHLSWLQGVKEIAWWKFEGMGFRLADGTFYYPDFNVMLPNGQLEMHEVKGFMREDANVKLKVAASMYPFVWKLVKRKGTSFSIQEI